MKKNTEYFLNKSASLSIALKETCDSINAIHGSAAAMSVACLVELDKFVMMTAASFSVMAATGESSEAERKGIESLMEMAGQTVHMTSEVMLNQFKPEVKKELIGFVNMLSNKEQELLHESFKSAFDK